jgi:hypothetical protein
VAMLCDSFSRIGQIWTAQNACHSRCLWNPLIDQDKLCIWAGKEAANAAYKEVMMVLLKEKEKKSNQEYFHELMDSSKDQIEY